MEVEEILVNVANDLDKRPQDVKRMYTILEKQKIEEGAKDVLPEEHFKNMILVGVMKKYYPEDDPTQKLKGFTSGTEEDDEDEEEEIDLDEMLGDDDDEELTLDLGLEDDESDVDVVKKFFEISPQEETGYSNIPNLEIMDNVIYNVSIDIKATIQEDGNPYHYNGKGKYGPYESWKFVVELLKVSPEEMYKEKHEDGDYKGMPLFIPNTKYNLWLNEKYRPTLVKFWRDVLGKEDFDGTPFAFTRTKKLSKNKRRYSVFKFSAI